MGTLNEDLSAIKEVEDKIIANKVARFAYTDEAYTTNDANGVAEYDVNKAQNIPTADASVLKVNETVLSKGYRAQASSVTRMLLNHFFGRMSYNLNKVNDNVSNLIATLIGHRGTANGFATLDESGRVPDSQLPVGKIFGYLLGRAWAQGTGSNTTRTFYSVYYANGIWVAGSNGRGLWWSTDGKAWTQGTGDNTRNSYGLKSIYYAYGIWVAASSDNGLWWSPNGKAWTRGTWGITTVIFYTVYYANGIWIAGSNGHGLWWSTDGKAWTQGTGDNTTYSFNTVYYANGIWVAGSNGHGLWWSTDGKAWTQGTGSNTTYDFNSIYYAYGIWVAASGSNGLWWSTDGKAWTQETGSNTSYGSYSIYYANGIWVAGSNGHGLWYSDYDLLVEEDLIKD